MPQRTVSKYIIYGNPIVIQKYLNVFKCNNKFGNTRKSVKWKNIFLKSSFKLYAFSDYKKKKNKIKWSTSRRENNEFFVNYFKKETYQILFLK